MSETMMIGGSQAGKTTFTMALKYYTEEFINFGKFNFIYGDKSEFRSAATDFQRNYEYPDKKTDTGFLVRFTFQSTGQDTTLDLMDLPGEQIADELENIGDRSRKEVKSDYESIREDLSSQQPLERDQWETLFNYRFHRSNSVIFLINIKKAVAYYNSSEDRPPTVLTENTVKRLSKGMNKTAVVLTACDQLEYDPSSFDPPKSKYNIDPTWTDSELADKCEEKLSNERPVFTTQDPRVTNVVDMAKSRADMDLFGVSIPESESKGDRIATDNGPSVKGFETFIRWVNR